MNKEEFARLAGRISDGTASKQDVARYNFYYNRYQLGSADEQHDLQESEEVERRLRFRIQQALVVSGGGKVRPIFPYWKVAAAVVLLIPAVIFFKKEKLQISPQAQHVNNDVPPGGNNAVLTLANGSNIVLNNTSNGLIAEQGGTSVNKTAEGELVYVSDANGGSAASQLNTLATPAGGQYQISLPDGTKVWLNAASSLRFPTAFTGSARQVELSGEAYFEVAKNKKVPFVVRTATQKIEVLGTHFNVNDYVNETETQTTLIEGSVKVSPAGQNKPKLLVPGEAAIIKGDDLSVKAVDVEESLAWKNGYFIFNDEHIRSIMRKVSRWYDVDVTYEEGVENLRFGGTVSRTKSLKEVIQILELTHNVKFKIEGRRITVMP